jgi:hypothetical protein
MNNLNKNSQDSNEDEWKNFAPELSRIKSELSSGKKANPFITPDGYFDSLNAGVMKSIGSIPGLASVAEENPFKVPAGYFDALPTIIQQKIIDGSAKRVSGLEWFIQGLSRPVPKYALAFASVILVLLLSTRYFTRTVKVEFAAEQLPETEQAEVAYLSQLDESVLADVYEEEAASAAVSQDEGIENYLLDNDIDLNTITEQL